MVVYFHSVAGETQLIFVCIQTNLGLYVMIIKLNMLLSHTLPAKNTLEVMLKNENAKQCDW